MSRQRVLVVSHDYVGTRMAGPGIRYWHFARELARVHDVTLATPNETDLEPTGFALARSASLDPRALKHLLRGTDAVVAQLLPADTMLAAARSGVRVIYDLYDPVVVENLARDALRPDTRHRRTVLRTNQLTETTVLRTGNAFICASERQRDYWLGALAAYGRIDHEEFRKNPMLRDIVDVVPFGIDPEPPAPGPAVKGVVPGIGRDDTLLIWPGGIWNWFDPLTAIRAVGRIAESRPDVRLFFLGVRHPNPTIERMEMTDRAIALSTELGLLDRVVFFNEDWVPYGERGRYLLDADLAVSAYFENYETRLAFRTRFLDCFWAGLPLVATRGDELAERAEAGGAAVTVPPEDDVAFANALESVLGDPERRAAMKAATGALRDALVWPRVVEPLAHLVEQPGMRLRDVQLRVLVARHIASTARWSLEVRGPFGAAKRVPRFLLRRVSARLR